MYKSIRRLRKFFGAGHRAAGWSGQRSAPTLSPVAALPRWAF